MGYTKTTLRGVARDAGVDASLVGYYFGSKSDLFAAAIDLPYRPHDMVSELLAAPVDELGEVLTRGVLHAWDQPDVQVGMQGVVQSVIGGENAFVQLREYVESQIVGPLATVLDTPDAGARASLAMSHLMGLAFARNVTGIRPLTRMSVDEIVMRVAPVIQEYLTGPAPR